MRDGSGALPTSRHPKLTEAEGFPRGVSLREGADASPLAKLKSTFEIRGLRTSTRLTLGSSLNEVERESGMKMKIEIWIFHMDDMNLTMKSKVSKTI